MKWIVDGFDMGGYIDSIVKDINILCSLTAQNAKEIDELKKKLKEG